MGPDKILRLQWDKILMSEVEYDLGAKWHKIYGHESLMKFWCKRWDKSLMSGGMILVSEVG